jgi:hypothetical protein
MRCKLRQLYARGKSPDIPCIGDLVVPRADLDAVAKKKIPASVRNRTPVFQPVASQFADSAIPIYL